MHLLAHVKWYQDHPQKFVLGNEIVLSATITEHMSSTSFIPVSRIVSRCVVFHTTLQLSYGEDNVCNAIPIKDIISYDILLMFVSVYLAFQVSISMFHATVQLSYMEKMKCVLPFLYIVDVISDMIR